MTLFPIVIFSIYSNWNDLNDQNKPLKLQVWNNNDLEIMTGLTGKRLYQPNFIGSIRIHLKDILKGEYDKPKWVCLGYALFMLSLSTLLGVDMITSSSLIIRFLNFSVFEIYLLFSN